MAAAKVRFPATNTEFTAEQLGEPGTQIPTQTYIVLLKKVAKEGSTVADDSRALVEAFTGEFGPWEHRSMFSGLMLSGVLDQQKVVWLLTTDKGECIKVSQGPVLHAVLCTRVLEQRGLKPSLTATGYRGRHGHHAGRLVYGLVALARDPPLPLCWPRWHRRRSSSLPPPCCSRAGSGPRCRPVTSPRTG